LSRPSGSAAKKAPNGTLHSRSAGDRQRTRLHRRRQHDGWGVRPDSRPDPLRRGALDSQDSAGPATPTADEERHASLTRHPAAAAVTALDPASLRAERLPRARRGHARTAGERPGLPPRAAGQPGAHDDRGVASGELQPPRDATATTADAGGAAGAPALRPSAVTGVAFFDFNHGLPRSPISDKEKRAAIRSIRRATF
jgi:hypothetical protein